MDQIEIKKKVFICVPMRNIDFARQQIKDLWKEKYSDYTLLNMANGIKNMSAPRRLAKHLDMINKADLLVFGPGWDSWAECILIKRIYDVFKMPAVEYTECADSTYDIVPLDTDSFDYDSISSLITALCKVPASFGININGVPNHYDDWLGLGVNYENETVDITDMRSIEIYADEIDSMNREIPKDVKVSGYNLSDMKEQGIKMFLVDIDAKYISKGINGILYTDRMNRSNFDLNEYDVYDVSGFDYSDWDCPIKVSRESLIDDYEKFELIGTLVVKKNALRSITDTVGCFYIDGENIIWTLGMEIH